MRRVSRKGLTATFFIGALLLLPAISLASPITAYEQIRDSLPLDPFGRDLERVRSSPGFFEVASADSTIVTQNSVNSNFGILNFGSVTYSHDVSWLVPASAEFLSAELEIKAFGVLGSNDSVLVDHINVGNLVNGGLLGFSTTIFENSNPLVLNFLLSRWASRHHNRQKFSQRHFDLRLEADRHLCGAGSGAGLQRVARLGALRLRPVAVGPFEAQDSQ